MRENAKESILSMSKIVEDLGLPLEIVEELADSLQPA